MQRPAPKTAEKCTTSDKLPSIIMNGRYRIIHNAKVVNHVELNITINNVIRNLRDERRSDF